MSPIILNGIQRLYILKALFHYQWQNNIEWSTYSEWQHDVTFEQRSSVIHKRFLHRISSLHEHVEEFSFLYTEYLKTTYRFSWHFFQKKKLRYFLLFFFEYRNWILSPFSIAFIMFEAERMAIDGTQHTHFIHTHSPSDTQAQTIKKKIAICMVRIVNENLWL